MILQKKKSFKDPDNYILFKEIEKDLNFKEDVLLEFLEEGCGVVLDVRCMYNHLHSKILLERGIRGNRYTPVKGNANYFLDDILYFKFKIYDELLNFSDIKYYEFNRKNYNTLVYLQEDLIFSKRYLRC